MCRTCNYNASAVWRRRDGIGGRFAIDEDLWREHAIGYRRLKDLVSGTAIVTLLAGVVFLGILDVRDGMVNALDRLCEHEELIDWDQQPELARELQHACGYLGSDYYDW